MSTELELLRQRRAAELRRKMLKAKEVTCPLCGTQAAIASYFRNGTHRLRLCPKCSVVFVYPRASGSELLSQYSPAYFEQNYESTRRLEYVSHSAMDRKQSFFLQQAAKLSPARSGPY